jgi:hypothetical protein
VSDISRVLVFGRDYLARHQDPWNRALHVVGVPLTPFLCLYLLTRRRYLGAGFAFVVGYGLQWLGHVIEGNEVGEWTLARKLVGRSRGRPPAAPASGAGR